MTNKIHLFGVILSDKQKTKATKGSERGIGATLLVNDRRKTMEMVASPCPPGSWAKVCTVTVTHKEKVTECVCEGGLDFRTHLAYS